MLERPHARVTAEAAVDEDRDLSKALHWHDVHLEDHVLSGDAGDLDLRK